MACTTDLRAQLAALRDADCREIVAALIEQERRGFQKESFR